MTDKRRITVGLVDDHNMFRKGVANFINENDELEVVLQADNAKDFLAEISDKGEPDVGVIDINMKGMLGYELVQKLTAKYPKMKLIALTMFSKEISIIRMLKNGAKGYVLKDSDPDELIKAIKVTYEDGFYHNDIMVKAMLNNVQNASSADLSELEMKFLEYCCTDYSYKEIAARMDKSPRTIDNYRDTLFNKLSVNSRVGLVIYAIKSGIFNINN